MIRISLLSTIVLLSQLAGCVIYEEEIVYGEDTATDENINPEQENPEAEPNFEIWLDPAGAVVGDSLILSVVAEGEINLEQVIDIEFFGDSEMDIIATQNRDENEMIVALDLNDSALGSFDVLVEFQDGTAAYVEDAFTVVDDPANVPDSKPKPENDPCD
jgi:hypothetical protein